MSEAIEPGDRRIQEAAEEIRSLQPPFHAAESWVRDRAVEILAIRDRHGLDRDALAMALHAAGVAQRGDRSRALRGTIISRALSAGRRAAAGRREGIDLARVQTALQQTVAAMFPTISRQMAIDAAVEALRLARTPESTIGTVPAPVPRPVPAASAPAPEPAPGGIAAFAHRRREAAPNASNKAHPALAALDALAPENLNLKPQHKDQGDDK